MRGGGLQSATTSHSGDCRRDGEELHLFELLFGKKRHYLLNAMGLDLRWAELGMNVYFKDLP